MKKLTALLIAMMLLLTVPVSADGLPYMRTVPQYTYIRNTLITPESYPEVRLFPGYASSLFSSYSDTEPLFLCFPGPAGALASSFSTKDACYLDDQNAIQYFYQEYESNSFEEFCNEASQDDYILLDGSDGTAAYIVPENRAAYGMIATKEFGKSSKLVIKMILDGLSTKMPEETLVSSLTDAILPEVQRVKDSMHYETLEPFWSCGQYDGVKILDYDFQKLAEITFPESVLNYSDGSTEAQKMFVTGIDGTRVSGMYVYSGNNSVEVEINFETYSYAVHNLEENEPNASEQTLENGNKWIVFLANIDSNNQIFSWYASKPTGYFDNYDKEYYVTVHATGRDSIRWADVADVMNDVSAFDENLAIVDAEADPYVPTETAVQDEPAPEPEETTAPAADGSWECPECGTENSGNFCSNCGTAKPVSNDWTCPECGTENTGNFCSNCGTAKP